MNEAHSPSDDAVPAAREVGVWQGKDLAGLAGHSPDSAHHDLDHQAGGHFVVDDAHLLFSGRFSKSGNDLVLSGDGREVTIHDYFRGEARAPIYAADGSSLSGQVVSALAGHVSFAQAGDPAPAAGTAIGQVAKLTGTAGVVRNGVTVELHVGDKVYKGDVVEAGADTALGITFIDGTAFSLGSNARMVLNEMVYDPNGSSNSSFLSLVQGSITFVAGQTAKNGSMKIDTPVATMGIRGTAVFVDIGANDGPTKFSVLVEPGNHVGLFELFNKVTGDKIGEVGTAGIQVLVSFKGFDKLTISEQAKTLADLQTEQALIQQVFSIAFQKVNDADPKFNFSAIGSGVSPFGGLFFYPFAPQSPPVIKLTSLNGPNGENNALSLTLSISENPPPIVKTTNASTVQSGGGGVSNVMITEKAAPGSFAIADHVTIIDPAVGVAPFYDIAVPYVPNTGVLASAVDPSFQAKQGYPLPFTLASLVSIDPATGIINYQHSFDFLAQGESVVYTFKFDTYGGPPGEPENNYAPYTVQETITLTIVGVNDPPVIQNPTIQNPQLSKVQDPGVQLPSAQLPSGSAHQASGSWVVDGNTYTFTDPDFNDTHKIGATFDAADSKLGAFATPFANTPLGTFSIDATQTDSSGTGLGSGGVVVNATPLHDSINGATGSFAWTLTLNAAQLAYIYDNTKWGAALTEVFDVTVTDNNGGVATQVVTIDLPMTDTWIGGASGDWSMTSNWSAGVPGPISNVEIESATIVTLSSSSGDLIYGLNTSADATLDITSGTLTIAGWSTGNAIGGPVNNGGTIEVKSNLTIDGATITDTTATAGLTVDAGASLTLQAGAKVIGGKLVNDGTVAIEASTGATLDGVAVTGGGGIQVDLATGAATLLLDDGTSITGGTLSIGDVGTLDVEQGRAAITGADATLDGVTVTGTDAVLTTTGAIVTPASVIEIGAATAATLLLDDGTSITHGTLTVGSGATLEIGGGAGASLADLSVGNAGTIKVDA
ncbi:MAG: FecR domain-containing protein, partial [Xanthobacteraceae bacterium]|nr:FecR domain-containing protein [Xanthobacteraceae bacterium]